MRVYRDCIRLFKYTYTSEAKARAHIEFNQGGRFRSASAARAYFYCAVCNRWHVTHVPPMAQRTPEHEAFLRGVLSAR